MSIALPALNRDHSESSTYVSIIIDCTNEPCSKGSKFYLFYSIHSIIFVLNTQLRWISTSSQYVWHPFETPFCSR